MKYLLLILFILMIQPIYASCDDDQIDINTASAIKLEELYRIGPVYAQNIIDTRPFESIDDLINVYGIGEVTLQKIKEQGLACVEKEEEKEDDEKEEEEKESEEVVEESKEIVEEETEIIKEPEIITLNSLNSKNIKTENNKKDLDKSDYARYGFVFFCILLVLLFILKENRK